MEIFQTIAASFSIRILNQDRELSGLVKNFHDIMQFYLNTVMNHVALKNCRRGSPIDQPPLADKSRPQEKSKSPNHSGFRGRGWKAFRRQRKGEDSSNKEDLLKRLEKLEKELARLQAETVSSNVNTIYKGND
ncbi:hypothetical protein O181_034146 [Austropuccinia psidii MF-1]|uniref:Uncharacterized protein n=1 Tax=Austropuccinia psidii MF-1 TaxID=1389203 RepID=A0A9Q3D043_9BASI|nr:hypothetical protein [Austropuccinia psidii MF-1]